MSRKEKGGSYFRELFNYAADGILIGNDDGIIEIANAAFYEISGLVADQVIGKHISALPYDPESLKQEPFRYDLLEKGLTVERQRLLIKPDQQKVYVEMRTRKLPNGGFQSLLRNVTERKQAEEALTNSEQKYHQLYSLMRLMADNMPDMLWAKDLNKKSLLTG
jgi:PAS domain S-box-containing protein